MDSVRSLDVIKPLVHDADYVDEKVVEGEVTLRQFLSGALSYYPGWIKALYGIRAVFVRFLGMRQEGMPTTPHRDPQANTFTPGEWETFFQVQAAQEDHYWIAHATDKHLTAHLAIIVQPLSSTRNRFTLLTVVHYHNWAGPVYFNVIRPFHYVLVNAMARAGIRVSTPPGRPFSRVGLWLMALAVLHQFVGLYFYQDALWAIGQAGIINAVQPPYWDRDAAFWFLMFGAMLFLYGGITHWLLAKVQTLPSFWGWGLLILSLIGVVLMPASGFWLAILLAIWMLRQTQRPQPMFTTA
jgi:hypothetical protein